MGNSSDSSYRRKRKGAGMISETAMLWAIEIIQIGLLDIMYVAGNEMEAYFYVGISLTIRTQKCYCSRFSWWLKTQS